MNAEETIAALRAELAAAKETIAALTDQVATLLERVKGLEGQRATDSHNSSKPPSSDGPARILRSLRGTSGKKPGGQPGHRGAHLRLVDTPDHIVVRRPLVCPVCAASLAAEEVDGMKRRQVVEAPPVRARVTEYQGLRVRCPHCQTAVTGTFPAAVSAPVQYGPRLRALTVYLTHQQLLPYGRTRRAARPAGLRGLARDGGGPGTGGGGAPGPGGGGDRRRAARGTRAAQCATAAPPGIVAGDSGGQEHDARRTTPGVPQDALVHLFASGAHLVTPGQDDLARHGSLLS